MQLTTRYPSGGRCRENEDVSARGVLGSRQVTVCRLLTEPLVRRHLIRHHAEVGVGFQRDQTGRHQRGRLRRENQGALAANFGKMPRRSQ